MNQRPGWRGARIHVAQFLILAKTPDRADALGDRVAEQFAHQMLLALVAGRQHDQVGGKRLAALHPRALGDKAFDIRKLPQADLAAHDQIGAADIEIIAAATGEVFELPAGAVLAVVELETLALQAIEQVLVQFLRQVRNGLVAFFRERQRHRGRDQVIILQRAFVIDRIGQLRRGFDIGDQGRAALNQRDLNAARMQVLRDIVAAVAGADHQRAFALPRFAVAILAGMQNRAGEIFQAGNIRQIRNAADAGGQHDMPRMQSSRLLPSVRRNTTDQRPFASS